MCGNQDRIVFDCPDAARFTISPDSVDVVVGQTANITVIQQNCGNPEAIFPLMAVTDTTIAWAINTHRFVKGRAPGTTTLVLTSDDGLLHEVGRVPVVVRQ